MVPSQVLLRTIRVCSRTTVLLMREANNRLQSTAKNQDVHFISNLSDWSSTNTWLEEYQGQATLTIEHRWIMRWVIGWRAKIDWNTWQIFWPVANTRLSDWLCNYRLQVRTGQNTNRIDSRMITHLAHPVPYLFAMVLQIYGTPYSGVSQAWSAWITADV